MPLYHTLEGLFTKSKLMFVNIVRKIFEIHKIYALLYRSKLLSRIVLQKSTNS